MGNPSQGRRRDSAGGGGWPGFSSLLLLDPEADFGFFASFNLLSIDSSEAMIHAEFVEAFYDLTEGRSRDGEEARRADVPEQPRQVMRPLIEEGVTAMKSERHGVWEEHEFPLVISAWMHLIFGHFTMAPMLGVVFVEQEPEPLEHVEGDHHQGHLTDLGRGADE